MMNLRKSFAILSISAVAAFAVGCGGGGEKQSDADQIKSNFGAAAKALSDGDGAGFCAQMTAESRARFTAQVSKQTGGANCAEGVGDLIAAVKAIDKGDWETFCAKIAPTASKQLGDAGKGVGGNGSCASGARQIEKTPQGKAIFKNLRDQLATTFGRLKTAKVTNVKITGDTATASLTPVRAGEQPIKFKKVDGEWKLAD